MKGKRKRTVKKWTMAGSVVLTAGIIWEIRRRKIEREIEEFDRAMREFKSAQKNNTPSEKYDILGA
ncbi:hypothetical protein [Sporofaciens sp. SGI.106]|uniref:hypothetical protein n=1 Tax=Sporofaciens sp. SGI.106 TaxID=3420568 RepID=UPI002A9351D9|nr:hypothetical protein [Lachnoclostridium sp.]